MMLEDDCVFQKVLEMWHLQKQKAIGVSLRPFAGACLTRGDQYRTLKKESKD